MTLGKTSLARLDTCDKRLQQLVLDVMAHIEGGALSDRDVDDLTVLCGYRGEAEQNKAFKDGASKLLFPHSKHNRSPAMAVDIAPYPIDWKNIARFRAVRELVVERAAALGIKIRIISWDWPHVELA